MSRCPWGGGLELRVPWALRPVRPPCVPADRPPAECAEVGPWASRHLFLLLIIIMFLFACFSLFTFISLNVLLSLLLDFSALNDEF